MILFLYGNDMTSNAPFSVYMGYDKRETAAYAVAEYSLKRRTSKWFPIIPLEIENLKERGLMWRHTEVRDGILWDVISEAPQATDFAISRFLTPYLHRVPNTKSGWAVFMDCDMLSLSDFSEIENYFDDKYAVMCVQHNYTPKSAMKMDNQVQTTYAKKNWSSVVAFNCDHPSNQKLTPAMINTLPGRDLHRFCWLQDHEIGALPPEWNVLVGENGFDIDTAKLAHYTLGGPWMAVELSPKEEELWTREYQDFTNETKVFIK